MGKAQHVAGLLYLNSIVQTKSLLQLAFVLGALWGLFKSKQLCVASN